MTEEEIKEESQKNVFTEFYEKFKSCENMDSLKEVFLKFNKVKSEVSESQKNELIQLKDDMRKSLESKQEEKNVKEKKEVKKTEKDSQETKPKQEEK
jgi:hypothetical protein